MNHPICPRCQEPVTRDPHELQMVLVNAHESAPEDATKLHATFHAACAGLVWNGTRRYWYGEDR
jgi:hypothetical protein